MCINTFFFTLPTCTRIDYTRLTMYIHKINPSYVYLFYILGENKSLYPLTQKIPSVSLDTTVDLYRSSKQVASKFAQTWQATCQKSMKIENIYLFIFVVVIYVVSI